jgi:hypothetical protein
MPLTILPSAPLRHYVIHRRPLWMPFGRAKCPANGREISNAIKERDGWNCKWCGLPQYAVFTYDEQGNWTLGEDGTTHKTYKEARSSCDFWNRWESESCSPLRYRVCVLTVAHLRLDAKHHATTASRTRVERAGQMALEVA